MKKFSACLAFVIFAFALVSFLSDSSKPSEFLYNVKRLDENLILMSKFSAEAKADYYSSLLDKRLEEVRYMSSNQKSMILSTSLRYATTAGLLTGAAKDSNEDQRMKISRQFENHLKEFQKIIANYPQDDSERKFLIDDVNYLNIYLKQLK